MIRAAALAFLLTGASASAASPSLADGFGAPHAAGTEAPTEVAARMEIARERYLRSRRLHITGSIAGIAGGLVTPVGLGMLVSGAFGQDESLAVTGAVLFFGGGATAVTGVVLSNVGAMNAAGAVSYAFDRPVPLTAGVAGISVLVVGALLTPVTSGVGAVVGVVGGVGLGVLQMSIANRPLVEAGLIAVVPTPNGAAVVGRF